MTMSNNPWGSRSSTMAAVAVLALMQLSCICTATTTTTTSSSSSLPVVSVGRRLTDESSSTSERQLNENNNNNNNNDHNNNNDRNNNNNNEHNNNNNHQQEQQHEEEEEADEYDVDLTPYSLRLERCQYIKELDGASSKTTPFSLEQYVVYRFCPKDSCGSNQCTSDYGEYVTTMYDYLYYLTEMNSNRMDILCNACDHYCWDDAVQNFMLSGQSVTCNGCKNKCASIENLNAYGYVDAANYISCTQVDGETTKHSYVDYYGATNYYYTTKKYYVGPKCVRTNAVYHSSSSKTPKTIRLGVFSDNKCTTPDHSVRVEDVLGYKVSYHNFRTSVSETSSQSHDECVPCYMQFSTQGSNSNYNWGNNNNNNHYNGNNNDNNNNNRNNNNNHRALNNNNNNQNNNQNDKLQQFCSNLHDVSAKCEAKHGFQSSMAQVNGYETQVNMEANACLFVDSLQVGSYTAYGDINTEEEQDIYDQYITHTQKMALLVLTGSIILLTLYGNYLNGSFDEEGSVLTDLKDKTQEMTGGIFT